MLWMMHQQAPPIRSVAVFCGSRPGHDPAHAAAAGALGTGLAASGIRLVYGGGKIGLMGVVADACLAAGGDVIGVIPEFLRAREVAHGQVEQLIVTDSMHSRKRRMVDMADAFVVLPGGFGTLDETIEVLTWRQLGLHDKPILVLESGNWQRGLRAALEASVSDGFAAPETTALLDYLPDVAAVLQRLTTAPAAPATPSARL